MHQRTGTCIESRRLIIRGQHKTDENKVSKSLNIYESCCSDYVPSKLVSLCVCINIIKIVCTLLERRRFGLIIWLECWPVTSTMRLSQMLLVPLVHFVIIPFEVSVRQCYPVFAIWCRCNVRRRKESNSMEQSPSWEAKSHSANQAIHSAFYGTRRFINMFTRARHWTLPWARWI